MGNDLISRKAAMETLKNVFDKYGVSWGEEYGGFAKAIPNAIKDLPTAYNVEGVIERLESLKQHEQEQHAYATVWGIEQSIEIVKGGVVDDETMA